MRKIILVTVVFLIGVVSLFAQDKPIFIPDQIDNSKELHLKCYCKPGLNNQSRSRGVDISYQIKSGRTFDDTDEFVFQNPKSKLRSSSEIEFKLKIPILNKPGLKFLAGYNYVQERYSFENIGIDNANTLNLLNNDVLKSNAFSLYLSKSLNKKHYVALRTRLIYNGNYDGLVKFTARSAFYNFIGFWGIKVNDDFECGIGLSFGSNIEEDRQLIPLISFNKNFNEKWGIEAILPGYIFLRNNISPRLMIFCGAEINGQNYVFDLPNSNSQDPNYFIFDHSKIQMTASVEYQLQNWIWMNLKVGYNFAFHTEFISNDENNFPSFETDPANHLFFKIGLFASPPDHLIK